MRPPVNVLEVMARAIRMAPVGGYEEERMEARAAIAELMDQVGGLLYVCKKTLDPKLVPEMEWTRAALSRCRGEQ